MAALETRHLRRHHKEITAVKTAILGLVTEMAVVGVPVPSARTELAAREEMAAQGHPILLVVQLHRRLIPAAAADRYR